MVLCLALAACTPAATVATETQRGVPDGYGGEIDLLDPKPVATWLDDERRQFAVVTVGSGSCPPVPTSIEATDADTIAITFVPATAPVCSADLSATTHVFDRPDEITLDGDVTIEILLDDETNYEYTVVIG